MRCLFTPHTLLCCGWHTCIVFPQCDPLANNHLLKDTLQETKHSRNYRYFTLLTYFIILTFINIIVSNEMDFFYFTILRGFVMFYEMNTSCGLLIRWLCYCIIYFFIKNVFFVKFLVFCYQMTSKI